MHLPLGHGLIKPLLCADRLPIAVIELAVRSFGMHVAACFRVLVALA